MGQATTARAPGESIGVPLLARILAPILGPFADTALSRSAIPAAIVGIIVLIS